MPQANAQYLPWIAYPGTITLAITFHLWLVNIQPSIMLATYLPVIIGLGLVIVLERNIPNRLPWQPGATDIKNDLVFMLLIQIALPRLLAFLAIIALVKPLASAGLTTSTWWPHHWQTATQVILMLVTAEFMRYWLHRFAHTNPLLWRLHAVHHSVDKLYWLNVGRFHPLDKTLQFLLDALPFLLLGVSEEVIALYFVFYAINGFFQHSNIKLHHGFLNYLISSAELHRWHHSRLTAEANNNYGNNLIIWDLVFGSWYLPKGRSVSDLGLKNHHYPMSFGAQMRTPFVKYITDNDTPMPGGKAVYAKAIYRKTLLKMIMGLFRYRYWWPLLWATRSPDNTQQRVLARILASNKSTRFGQENNFSDIKTYNDFMENISIREYDDLAPYFDKQIHSRDSVITAQRPLLYARTSGTTGTPKYLPVTETAFRHYRDAQRVIVFHQFRQCPEALRGRFLAIVSPATEGYLANDMPYGSVSGLAYQVMPSLIRANYILPPAVFDIEDYDLKYALILRLALAEQDISYIATANPSSLLRLMEVFQQTPSAYIEDIATGGFHRLEQLPAAVREAVEPVLAKNKPRANHLSQLLEHKPRLSYAELWPELRLISTWTGGSCGTAVKALKRQLPMQTQICELGYISSEFRGTITLDIGSSAGVPTLTQHFFEFIDKDAYERGGHQTLLLEQLENGAEYYIVITTDSGLYRYFMNDIVRVRGFQNRTPLLEFVQKGKGVTSITGEKLYESQVRSAIEQCENSFNLISPFYLMLADEENSRYLLLIEFLGEVLHSTRPSTQQVADFLDTVLGDINIEYRDKRNSGRLKPLTLLPLKANTADAFKQHCLAQGMRESQFKVLPLMYKKDLDFSYQSHLTRPAD